MGHKRMKLVLQGLFGKIYKVTTTKQLQDNDTLAPLTIRRLVLSYGRELRKTFGKKPTKKKSTLSLVTKNGINLSGT